LWNTVKEDFFDEISDHSSYSWEETDLGRTMIYIWKEFFGKPVDSIAQFSSGTVQVSIVMGSIRDWFFGCSWMDVYDFVEFIAVNPVFID
jgi:hypothetical protein